MLETARPRIWIAPLLLSLACGCGCGCGGGRVESETPTRSKDQGIERYLPLGDGCVYTYETTTEGSGERDMLLLRVRRIDKRSAQMQTPSGVRDLAIAVDSIRRQGSGYVLRAPLHQDATWEGDNGGKTRVDAVGVKVTVPAGTFEDCVRTVEEVGGADKGRITTVFCNGVGIAEMHIEQWEDTEHAAKRFVLKSYGPPVNLDAQR